MKKFSKGLICFLLIVSILVGVVGCDKEHVHNIVTDAKVEPTCMSEGLTEGSHCSTCGEVIVAQQTIAKSKTHNYSDTYSTDKYFHWFDCEVDGCTSISGRSGHKRETIPGYEATVDSEGLSDGVKCSVCGLVIEQQQVIPKHQHNYSLEVANANTWVSSATPTTNAIYKKSCSCGALGTDTFEVEVDRTLDLEPTSPTMTLYETGDILVYGFTWNSVDKPYVSVISIKESDEDNYTSYEAEVKKYSSYDSNEEIIYFYVSKVEVILEPNCEYDYYLWDTSTGETSDTYTFTACDPNVDAFTFASFSDSQTETGGSYFNKVLQNVADVDFYLHTGDICEDSKHEANWTAMLDYNKEYFTSTPIMVAAGNHDTTYKSGSNEVFKHFNNNITAQNTDCGYHYSFDYGNARFIVLNTNELASNNALPTAQYNWLIDLLQNNDKDWTIVAMHNPMYSIGKWGSDPDRNSISVALRGQLTSIFAQYGVDLVIQGHDHMISKTNPINGSGSAETVQVETIGGVQYYQDPNGTIYIMNGPSGNQSRSDDFDYDESLYDYAENSNVCSWAEYTIDGDTLTVVVKYVNYNTGVVSTYHTWGIEKSN